MKKTFCKFLLITSLIAISCSHPGLEAAKKHLEIPSEKQIIEMEIKLIDLVNKEREKYGLQPLTYWEPLAKEARTHSQNMASGITEFGHDGFHDRVDVIRTLSRHISMGENVAYSYGYKDPLKVAVEGWMDSPGHKENILGDYEETGMGIAFNPEGRCYSTQLFAKRYRKVGCKSYITPLRNKR